jgi:hypothetical protein
MKTLPKLDHPYPNRNEHNELGITEKVFLVHYMNMDTNLVCIGDEDDRSRNTLNATARLSGLHAGVR